MVSSCKNSVKAFCANLVLHDRAIGDYQEFNKDLHKFRHLGEQYSEDNLKEVIDDLKKNGVLTLFDLNGLWHYRVRISDSDLESVLA